jgi:GTPase
MSFIDEAVIHVRAGRGGSGCVAFRREKFVPRGGPSGGDGGHGGAVYLVGSEGLNTLYHLRLPGTYAAERGRHGEGSRRTGRSGVDLEIPVPPGTVAQDAESGELLGEVLSHGERLLVAAGGRGGRGNARFASATQRAPRQAEPGGEGVERRLRLELKLLADVGVVGLPNAGKSTLISRISAARPKIGDYPFTTLVPHLGVVSVGETATGSEPGATFVVADLPGLIAGAAQGAGLGIQFLRHVERCRVLLHLVELAAEGSLEEELRVVERELVAFDPSLLERPRLLVGSKLDTAGPARRQELAEAAARRGLPWHEVSAVAGDGIPRLVGLLAGMLQERSEEA